MESFIANDTVVICFKILIFALRQTSEDKKNVLLSLL